MTIPGAARTAIDAIEDAGIVVERLRGVAPATFAARSDGRKIAHIVVSSSHDDQHFDIAVWSPDGKSLIETRSRVPSGPSGDRHVDGVVSLFRSRAYLDGLIPIEMLPTDHALREWIRYARTIPIEDAGASRELLSSIAAIDPDTAEREDMLRLHCEAMGVFDAPGEGDARRRLEESARAISDHEVAHGRLLWKRRDWAAALRERVPNERILGRRPLGEVQSEVSSRSMR